MPKARSLREVLTVEGVAPRYSRHDFDTLVALRSICKMCIRQCPLVLMPGLMEHK